MVSAEFSEGISETLDILSHMERSYIDKIPKKFRVFLEMNKSENYISNLDHSKKIKDMGLKEKTKDILAIIYMNYWCTPQKKEEYNKLLNENEVKYQEELREKYNTDNIFKKAQVKESIAEEKINDDDTSNNIESIVEYKESLFNKIMKRIKSIFNR